MHGYTVLGDAKAELTESYAMPIPPNTPQPPHLRDPKMNGTWCVREPRFV